MPEATGSYSVEERGVHGDTVWVAIRARGGEWSWLTPAEAARLGRQWVKNIATNPIAARSIEKLPSRIGGKRREGAP